MILEAAMLKVRPDQEAAFEEAFREAQSIIASMPGYVSHGLHRNIDKTGHYLLLVTWQRLEDHTVGFRCSPQYQEWRRLLHHFYEPLPSVEHYRFLAGSIRPSIPADAPAAWRVSDSGPAIQGNGDEREN
jgi:heme-degrading monooxygenase HmoA